MRWRLLEENAVKSARVSVNDDQFPRALICRATHQIHSRRLTRFVVQAIYSVTIKMSNQFNNEQKWQRMRIR